MDRLSKEELMALLASKTEKPKKERKKTELPDDKKLAMLERLAAMRETVAANREKKRAAVVDHVRVKEKDIDEVFEKKYGSKFDKMSELLTDLNENTKEVVKMKKEKAAKREIKPTPKKEVEPVEDTEPVKAEPPKPMSTAAAPVSIPLPTPSPFVFRKGNTRF
jgi:hypothetical protein